MTIVVPQESRLDAPAVVVDLYRDIHKGIRAELFAVTEEAGRIDPSPREERAALAGHLAGVVELLVSHAEHEDRGVQPTLEDQLPLLAERIAADHEAIESRMNTLEELAGNVVEATTVHAPAELHRLYLELASFTSAYLEHQDVEERVVGPALEQAIGIEAATTIHAAIVASIPPAQLATSLAIMLPAMNVDGRAELLGGIRAGAPAEVFQGVWSLAGSVLTASDRNALAARLGLG